MSTHDVCIVSAKFAPGLMKEFGLLGDNLERRGARVRYLLAEPYGTLGWDRPDTHYITTSSSPGGMVLDTMRGLAGGRIGRLFAGSPAAVLYFYNTHPVNPLLARRVRRKSSDTLVVVHLHDPYKPDKTPYGRKGALKVKTVELVQRLTAMQADHIVFPSEYSLRLFGSRYAGFSGTTHVAPLLVPDQSDGVVRPRMHFSMVGRMHRATGHDTFLDLVNYAAERGLAHRFALICAGDLSKYLAKLTPQGRKLLTVISKPMIDDTEIDTVIGSSHAVFRLAKEVTQSGVVPVAFMNHTPVIARDIPGLRQHVRHQHDGYLVPADCSPVHLLEAMEYVQAHFARLSENARQSYEGTWSEANWDRHYGWLMQLLESHETAHSKS
jgi:glycosyltransferase involved in cell wall biosynthesis